VVLSVAHHFAPTQDKKAKDKMVKVLKQEPRIYDIAFIFNFLAPVTCWADIYIITHAETKVPSISRKELAAIYLLKKNYWPDDSPIVPLNLPAQNALREQFSLDIFKRSTREMGEYWNKMSFKGVKPPITQASEQAALLFIQRVPNTIAYVGDKPPENKQVKILLQLKN